LEAKATDGVVSGHVPIGGHARGNVVHAHNELYLRGPEKVGNAQQRVRN
jgi:hypothetical protein